MAENVVMEEVVSGAIVRRYFEKLQDNLAVDVAIVGAGPSGLVAAHDLAKAGFKVAVYESKLAPGGILGEKPMWMADGERTTVINTKRLYPGLYASGMAANNVQGGFRMGPIFGGMLKSGRKIAQIVAEDLNG